MRPRFLNRSQPSTEEILSVAVIPLTALAVATLGVRHLRSLPGLSRRRRALLLLRVAMRLRRRRRRIRRAWAMRWMTWSTR